MFTKLFVRIVTPIVNAIAAAILKSDTAKEWMAQAIADRVNVKKLAEHLDYGAIFDNIDTDDLYTHVAKHTSVSASDIAEHLDSEDIAQHVEIDYYEVASHMEASEVAGHFDLSDVARELEIDVDDVTVDYEALAKALLRQLGAASKVEVKSSK
jgi:hypothetical protein